LLKTKIKAAIIILTFIASVCPASFCFVSAKYEKLSALEVPKIYPRSSWSKSSYDKRTKKMWPAKYEDPEVIVVHHTAASYSGSTAKQVQKIFKYHSYTKKWGDIGYNYVIGKNGMIFEGRYGGNGAVGGHAYYNGTNFNEGSIGIAIIGNYEDEKLSAEARDSLEKLIGWLAANNNIDINSSIRFHGKNLDDSVIGHQDIGDTDCPGTNIYKNLDEVRSNGFDFAATYANYAYSYESGAAAYEIVKGKRYSGSGRSPVINVSKTQIFAYDSGGEAEKSDSSASYTFPSGTLVKIDSGTKKGLIEINTLREITSSAVLDTSYDTSSFVEITEEKWASYPVGAVAGFRSGSFLKSEDGNYYAISGGQKRRLELSGPDIELLDLSSAHTVMTSELSVYAEGNVINSLNDFPEGSLITSNYKTYYFISGGQKKKVTKNVFRATFSRSMAIKVSAKFLKKYVTNGKLSFRNGATVNYRGKYYFIENEMRRQFMTKGLAAKMGYKNIVKAKRTEMAGIGKSSEVE
jgi:hypothetical protein